MDAPLVAAGVFGASLLGSVHCAGMCGGFACLYAGDAATRHESPLTGHAAYHGGRLAAYASLGAVGGAIGAGVEQMGAMAGVTRAATMLAGALLVLWGAALLANVLGVRVLPSLVRQAVPARWTHAIGRLLLALREQPLALRAGALGLLTALLPCGWLYAFVVTAAGTGSALDGALVMAVFWAGTVPALVAVAVGMRRATGALQRHLPVASALLVIGVGVAALAGRLAMPPSAHAGHGPAMTHAPASTHAPTTTQAPTATTDAMPATAHDH